MDKWALVHDFRRLVERGILSPLICPEDGLVMRPTVGKSDEPEFKCAECNSKFRPGLDFYDQIERNKG